MDGFAVLGITAERLAAVRPGGLFHDFTRRVGDPVPVIGRDGSTCSGAELVAIAVACIVRERAAGGRAHVTIAHPSAWGDHEIAELRSALAGVGFAGDGVSLVTAAEAAFTTVESAPGVGFARTVALVDVGDRFTDLALIHRSEGGPVHVRPAACTEELSGTVLDRAVAAYVVEQVRSEVPALDPGDSANWPWLRELAARCRAAREQLSRETSAVVPVALRGFERRLRLTRPEFESLIREPVVRGTAAVARTVDGARAGGLVVDAVALTGGASATPLIVEAISARLRLPVLTGPHPAVAAASGAAGIAAARPARPLIEPVRPAVVTAAAPVSRRRVVRPAPVTVAARARDGGDTAVPTLQRRAARRSRVRPAVIGSIAAIAAVLGMGGYAATPAPGSSAHDLGPISSTGAADLGGGGYGHTR
ncbi:Hsp70 family protein [Pseudonocardia acidicola]|uniref:Hsp70 family protein n=1 Tax=Pseudonocardia acidicola TaxID=2724939 RepID=A0ABX1SLV6_9PSEU|nr:Hsp70 family protein [Pseudonocardia acidicola]NMI01823.1 Hsp70 family protein [Pseudonocardia acidicola]